MLKGHLVAKLWQAISELPRRETRCFTTIGNYVDQFDSVPCQVPQSLSHYIDKTGPYHVVLDALNIGYRNMNCKNPVTRFSVDQVCDFENLKVYDPFLGLGLVGGRIMAGVKVGISVRVSFRVMK